MIRRLLLAVAALALATTWLPSGVFAKQVRCRGIAGATLCIPLPRGWFGSVGFGVVSRRDAAWLLAGNFRFPSNAASNEGLPLVPSGRVLISIGDFPVSEQSLRWRRVKRLRLPNTPESRRAVAWRVRFAGRALLLNVRFGSTPTAKTRSLVNLRLAAVHRIP